MLAQLRSFLVVVEEGSLNRAATLLRISQPALSRQMQALEAEIGGRLLERTSSGVQPTDAGHALAARMRPILSEYEAAMAEARRLVRGQKEQLRIGYLASAAQQYLTPALTALRRAHPEVKVSLMDLSPGEQMHALRKGDLDVALIGQEGCLLARDFYTRKLATLSVVAVVPADHPLAKRKRVHLEELKGERFIGAPDSDMPGRNRWITELCRNAGFRPKFVQDADSLSHSLALIASEGAVTLFPDYLRNYPAAGIAMIPVEDRDATWDFLVVWQRGRTAGPLAALLEALPG
ncbi:LysR family transcriptional regulator [Verrucomicrobiota bacterium sgz303538]